MRRLAAAPLFSLDFRPFFLAIAGASRVFPVPFSGWGLGLSALLWSGAFGLFLMPYTGILLRPRL
ncbi:MAG: hypothetical protein WBH22_17720 [Pseudomonas mandelii]|uniref:hypothetical protein n=1 Tax=Pseudomonas mandelii TaxID=75612 RepID=UPI003C729521